MACARESKIQELIDEWKLARRVLRYADARDPDDETYARLPRRYQKVYDSYRNDEKVQRDNESFCNRVLERNVTLNKELSFSTASMSKALGIDEIELKVYFQQNDPKALSRKDATICMRYLYAAAQKRGIMQTIAA